MKTHTLSPHEAELVASGLARLYRGRLIPVMRGGDPQIDPIFPSAPEDLTALSAEELQGFIDASAEAFASVQGAPSEFVNEERNARDLVAEVEAGVAALDAARAELASRTPDLTAEELSAQLAELAPAPVELANEADPADDDDPAEPAEPAEEAAAEEPESLAAAAPRVIEAAPALPRPGAQHRIPVTSTPEVAPVALVASGSGLGPAVGNEVDLLAVANMMIAKRRAFGAGKGGAEERFSIAKADWSDQYPDERHLSSNVAENDEKIKAAFGTKVIRQVFEARKKQSLVAAGGLCAPVTPYYGLQTITTADRPVRAALAAFNADRGGILAAAPAGLGAISTGVGSISAADDAAGGTFATKTCQVIDCPDFSEVDVAAIYHCLQVGNLPSRTYPELVVQWNELLLAAQARLAESALLTAIDGYSTSVVAGTLGLGASASLLGQILAAANGLRNRNRMDPEAVLRLLLPDWTLDLMISDVIRSQFARFETTEEQLTALLRSFDIEPTFYIDGASGAGQVFGAQTAGDLLSFPPTVRWYLYPEGSFLFLDGGSLELGLVRDSVLNATNDLQMFGETFENAAFIGVESLAVTSNVCDNGAVSLPVEVACIADYSPGT